LQKSREKLMKRRRIRLLFAIPTESFPDNMALMRRLTREND